MIMRNRLRVGAAIVAVVALAGCSATTNGAISPGGSQSGDSSNSSGPQADAVLTTNVKDGAQVAPGTTVKVSAAPGWAIRVTSKSTPEISGTSTADNSWASDPLPPKSTWSFEVSGEESGTGNKVTKTISGTAVGSKNSLSAEITPDAGAYGVGIIPRITFSDGIKKSDRANLVKRMLVQSSVTG